MKRVFVLCAAALALIAAGVPAAAGPGPTLTSQSYVAIAWPSDGGQSIVRVDRPVAGLAGLGRVVAQQAVAEGRPATDAILAGTASSTPQPQGSWGTTACNVQVYLVRPSASTVMGTHDSGCTADVYWQGASLVLYRAYVEPIARGAQGRFASYLHVQTDRAQCRPQWHHVSDEYHVSSSVNGSRTFFYGSGVAWLYC